MQDSKQKRTKGVSCELWMDTVALVCLHVFAFLLNKKM